MRRWVGRSTNVLSSPRHIFVRRVQENLKFIKYVIRFVQEAAQLCACVVSFQCYSYMRRVTREQIYELQYIFI